MGGADGMSEGKRAVVLGIGLQTHVLKTCAAHGELYFDDDDNTDRAFALAVELIRQHSPCVSMFNNDVHELTDLLSHTLAGVAAGCPRCRPTMMAGRPSLALAADLSNNCG